MKRKERLFGVLLSLMLMLVLMAGMSAAAHAETTYPVWVGGVQVTSANMGNVLAGDPVNDGKVSYTPATDSTPAILALSNTTITGGSYTDKGYVSAAIFIEGDLTIDVTGGNHITGSDSDSESDDSYGIFIYDNLNVTGTGYLSAAGGAVTGQMRSSYGVLAGGAVTVEEGSSLFAEGGTAAGENGRSYGVFTFKDVTANGDLHATGDEASFESCGVFASGDITASESGLLNATGGAATGPNGRSYGVDTFDGAVTVNGTLIARGGTADIESCGVVTSSGAVVTVSGTARVGTSGNTQAISGSVKNAVTGTGWTNTKGTEGETPIAVSAEGQSLESFKNVIFPTLYPIWVGGVQVTSANMGNVLAGDPVNDGRVSCTPATDSTPAILTLRGATISDGKNINSFLPNMQVSAIYAIGDLAIDVTASSTVTCVAAGNSYGIRVDSGSLTVTGPGRLSATGGEVTRVAYDLYGKSCGVYADGNVNVAEGATLTAAGGETTNVYDSSYGVYAKSGDITVAGTARLIATGNTQAISGSVKNAVAGTGWTNVEGTEGETPIAVSAGGQSLESLKKVQLPTLYPIWVGGVQVTSANMGNVLAGDPINDGKVSFTPATDSTPATLTLSGATISDGNNINTNTFSLIRPVAAIYAKVDLTIDVIANSTVTSPAASGGSYGIRVDSGSLTVTGPGQLSATGGTVKRVMYGSFYGSSCGVYAAGTVTIAEGTMLIATGGETTSSNDSSYGVYAVSGDVIVNGELTATGGPAKGNICGVYAKSGDITVAGTARLIATGDTQAISGSVKNAVAGTGWTNVDATDGETPIAVSAEGQSLESYKRVMFPTVYPIFVGGVLVTSANMGNVLADDPVNNGRVSFTPAEGATPATLTLWGATITSGDFIGNVIYAEGDLTIDVTADSTVTGPSTSLLTVSSCGIYVNNGSLTVTGPGKLTATGGPATWSNASSYGVYTKGTVTVAEGVTLTATGGAAYFDSCGIYAASGDITVNGKLNATGCAAMRGNSCGVYAASGDVIVNGTARLTATGDTQAISGSVKNAVAGTGWTNVEGTEGRAAIAVSAEGQSLKSFKKIQFLAHYSVWVGGTPVTDANMGNVLGDGTVSYTPAEGTTPATLTLNGASITDGHTFITSDFNHTAAIYAEGDLTIYVAANGTVTGPESDFSYGIFTNGSLTVTGPGTLTATGGAADIDSCGVSASTVIVNGTLSAAGNAANSSCGVYAYGDVTVNGTLTATGGEARIHVFKSCSSYGVYAASGDVIVNGTLTAAGGTAMGNGYHSFSCGVSANRDVIVYGELTATAMTATGATGGAAFQNSGDSCGVSANGDVIVYGELTATGGTAADTIDYSGNSCGGNSYGVYAYITIAIEEGGTLTAAGGTATGENCGSYGVYSAAESVNVNGELTAAGGAATNGGNSCGIFTIEEVTVEESGTLTATGNTQAISGSVRNAVTGTGWTNVGGTQGGATIAVSAERGQDLYQYRKVQFLAAAPSYHRPDFLLPKSIRTIGANAFEGGAMKVVYISDNCTAIGAGAFKNCANLTQIRLPRDCAINDTAFDGCGKVYVFAAAGGTTESWCQGKDNIIFVRLEY